MKYNFFIFVYFLAFKKVYTKKNFFKRLNIACKYNRNNLVKIIDNERCKVESKISDKELDKAYIENFSSNSSDELIDLLKDNTIFYFQVNKEYFYFLSLVVSQILSYTINESVKTKNKEESIRIIIKNIIIPMIIHDSIKLLITFIKQILNIN